MFFCEQCYERRVLSSYLYTIAMFWQWIYYCSTRVFAYQLNVAVQLYNPYSSTLMNVHVNYVHTHLYRFWPIAALISGSWHSSYDHAFE